MPETTQAPQQTLERRCREYHPETIGGGLIANTKCRAKGMFNSGSSLNALVTTSRTSARSPMNSEMTQFQSVQTPTERPLRSARTNQTKLLELFSGSSCPHGTKTAMSRNLGARGTVKLCSLTRVRLRNEASCTFAARTAAESAYWSAWRNGSQQPHTDTLHYCGASKESKIP